jgi:hypothetical protein
MMEKRKSPISIARHKERQLMELLQSFPRLSTDLRKIIGPNALKYARDLKHDGEPIVIATFMSKTIVFLDTDKDRVNAVKVLLRNSKAWRRNKIFWSQLRGVLGKNHGFFYCDGNLKLGIGTKSFWVAQFRKEVLK